MMNKWFVHAKRADFQRISEKFGIDPVVSRILRNRDITSDEEIDYFLNAGIDDLYDEMLMPDIEKAAKAVYDAAVSGRHIRIVGDYDIDGVCSTYILLEGLKRIGANVDCCIPDRINDGYGINMNIVNKAHTDAVELILTCDNGIAALDELKVANELGMRVVVTDHHNVRKNETGDDILPEALAVVDVKRQESKYPSEECCGAVTAWKLIKRVYALCERRSDEWLDFLEFAAIATVGDIMKLTGENRVIVKEGLKQINEGSHNLGLRTLIEELELTEKTIDTYHIGFIIGPCINAGGRLETAESALKLFTSTDRSEAELIAGHLRLLNAERKAMTEAGTKEGISIVESTMMEDSVLVVYIEDLHESLAGIVAGRLKERYCKPCIVITKGHEGLKGSGRSIESYDMFSALCEAEDFLTKYGGHKMAAGLSLKEENLNRFREFLNSHSGLNEKDFIKKLWIDDPTPLSYVNMSFIAQLDSLKPYGQGFERPQFACRNLRPSNIKVLGKAGNVVRFRLSDLSGGSYDALMFGDGEAEAAKLRAFERIDILYTPQINEFAGRKNIQIDVIDYNSSSKT